jgi:Glycosyl transferase family 2
MNVGLPAPFGGFDGAAPGLAGPFGPLCTVTSMRTTSRPILAPEAPTDLVPRVAAPSFSVVIAAYRVADVVEDAIGSVLAQTVAPLEVIVVDDGSGDGIEDVVARHADGVRFLRHEVNRGAGAAMNTGARAAEGDYVVFIGADDVFAPERLEALGELARLRPDLGVLTTDAWVSVDGEVFRRFHDETFPFEVSNQRREILRRNFVFGHAAMPRGTFLELGGFDETIRWTSDWELMARMIVSGWYVGLVAEPLATYRLSERALSSQPLQQARGRRATLQAISGYASLTDAERGEVDHELGEAERRIALLEAMEALRERSADARRRAFVVFANRGNPPVVRLRALLASALPGPAGRVLARRHEQFWVGAGALTVRRRR